jgi:hypothetical protein
MELLLNLAWLLLALPAYWLWQRAAAGARLRRRFSPLQGLLALGCVLVLLFPVISASDDLHAMRAEMEDSSSTNKRTVRQSSSDRNSGCTRLQGPPAVVAGAVGQVAPEVRRLEVFVRYVSPAAAHCILHGGRAPPFSFLG